MTIVCALVNRPKREINSAPRCGHRPSSDRRENRQRQRCEDRKKGLLRINRSAKEGQECAALLDF